MVDFFGWGDLFDEAKDIIKDVVSDDSYTGIAIRTAILGTGYYAINKSIENDRYKSNDYNTLSPSDINTTINDSGTRVQVNPSPENKIPVLYGQASFGGHIIDVSTENNNQDLWVAMALAETTGTKQSDGLASAYTFNDVFYNGNRVFFQSDGITADYMIDSDGNRDESIKDLIKIYFYAGNSTSPQVPEYYTNNSVGNAYDNKMPGWTSDHTMDNLLFALVKITYNHEKGVKRIPTLKFQITNSMSLPGDCLYDYMTNTRYGAGLTNAEINT